MNERLEDLMKRAGKAHAQKRQREIDRKFFIWLENTFNINEYDKTSAYEKPAAVVGSALVFVRSDAKEMSAVVYSKCNVCKNEVHRAGVVKNIDELGERLNLDEQGNFPDFCEHFLIRQPKTLGHQLFSDRAKQLNNIEEKIV